MTAIRYALRKKAITGGWKARLRALWWIAVKGEEGEICMECGRPVGLVWWCYDNALWERVTGFVTPLGGTAPGLLCIPCFDAAVRGLPETIWVEWACGNLRHLGR